MDTLSLGFLCPSFPPETGRKNQTVEVDQLLDIFTHTLGGALRAKIAWAPRVWFCWKLLGGVKHPEDPWDERYIYLHLPSLKLT